MKDDNAGMKIRVAIADEDVDTKTSLDLGTKKLTWVSTDKIYLYAPADVTLWRGRPFSVDPTSISVDGHSATFTEDTPTADWSVANKMVATYGARFSEATQVGWYGGGTPGSTSAYIVYFYPRHQTYQAGGPNPEYLIMMTDVTTDPTNLIFKNLTSVIKLQVKNTDGEHPCTLKSIKVVCDNNAITGRWYRYELKPSSEGATAPDYNIGNRVSSFSPTYNNYPGYKSISLGGTYGNTAILEGINVALTSTPQDFYIVVASENHGNLTFTLTDSADNEKTFTYSNGFNSAKGKIYKFPVIDWSSK